MALQYDGRGLHGNKDSNCALMVCYITWPDVLEEPTAPIFRVETICILKMTATCSSKMLAIVHTAA